MRHPLTRAKPSQAKPSQAKPSQAKPSQAYLKGDVVLVHHVLADMTQEGVSLVGCSPHRGQSASTRQSRWETGRLKGWDVHIRWQGADLSVKA